MSTLAQPCTFYERIYRPMQITDFPKHIYGILCDLARREGINWLQAVGQVKRARIWCSSTYRGEQTQLLRMEKSQARQAKFSKPEMMVSNDRWDSRKHLVSEMSHRVSQ